MAGTSKKKSKIIIFLHLKVGSYLSGSMLPAMHTHAFLRLISTAALQQQGRSSSSRAAMRVEKY